MERIYDFALVLDWEIGLLRGLWLHIRRHFLSISWKLRLGEISVEAHRMLRV
jgi:hypothetical protein